MSTLTVKIAGIDALSAVLDFMGEFNVCEAIPWERSTGAVSLRRLLQNPEAGLVGVILEGERLRGYFVITWGFDLEWGGRDAFLTELYLMPDARSRGRGTAALPLIEALASRYGARALHLMVRPENDAAIQLYRRAGYASPPRVFLTKVLGAPEGPAHAASTRPRTSDFAIRALEAGDAAPYNAFLRKGVERHPDTLRIAPADIDAAPFATTPSSEAITFAAEGPGGGLVGVASLERERGREKRRHIAWLLRMYVDAAHSGVGAGRALLSRVVAEARRLPGVNKLNLTVAAHNERALDLYTSEGFRVFSREENAFFDTQPRDELSLSLTW